MDEWHSRHISAAIEEKFIAGWPEARLLILRVAILPVRSSKHGTARVLGWGEAHATASTHSASLGLGAQFSDTFRRIPEGWRFSTLTEPPNNERIRCATGG